MEKVYRGSLTREQFLFYEIRVVAKLLYQGENEEEIRKKIYDNNLFQLPTEKSISTITTACYKRLTKAGNERLIDIIANESNEVAKQAALYLLMRYNAIVWDFMVEVIGTKYKTRDFSFDKSEVNHFLSNLRTENDEASEWTDATINKIRSVLIKILSDTGYLTTIKSTELNYITLFDEVQECINQNCDFEALCAFNYLN